MSATHDIVDIAGFVLFPDLPNERLERSRDDHSLDRDILSIRHIAEPEYSAFAVMQIVSQGISRDMTQLTE